MPVNDELGIRMKEYYEKVPNTKLLRRVPVIIRIDGKAFHTFTKGFKRPYDEILSKSMQDTMKYLCENIQGAVLGYTQSDEITIVLQDYKKLTSNAWFDYKVQKMCSIAASMATLSFNKCFCKNCEDYLSNPYNLIPTTTENDVKQNNEFCKYADTLQKAIDKGAMFDARCFNVPKEEVTNLLYWRQVDAVRNSIQMLGQANFSHKELQNKTCNQIQDMLFTEKGINWNDVPTQFKRGSCCVKKEYSCVDLNDYTGDLKSVTRTRWEIDNNIPMFNNSEWEDRTGRDYVETIMDNIVEED